MLGFLRRITQSRIGLTITMIGLVIIALLFTAGDLSSFRSGGVQADTVAKVGSVGISENELRDRVRTSLNIQRRQNPNMTMQSFMAEGGFEETLRQMTDMIAMEAFGQREGMHVGQKMVDGKIASIPAFRGINGKFDQQTFDQVLGAQGITAQQLRDDIRSQTYSQWLLLPTMAASDMPKQMALPYASLTLEKRHGEIGFIPTAAVQPGDKPDDKALTKYYQQHISDYTVPERRIMHYAIVHPDDVAAKAKPSDAEVEQAYKNAGTRFAASQTRTVKQVVVADQSTANQIAAKIRGGSTIDAAAKSAGLEASTISDSTKADLAGQTSAAYANAAFSAAKDALIGPIKLPLGWYVGRVEAITNVPGKTLEQARPEIVKELTEQKQKQLMGDLQDKLDDNISGGSTFAEAVKDAGIAGQTTKPLTVNGTDPDAPTQQPDPQLAKVVQAGFAAQPGDTPQVISVGDDGSFALVSLAKVVPAAPKPLAQIHDQVMRDYMIDQANQKARDYASKAVKAINSGKSIQQAIAATGIRTPPSQKIDISRGEIMSQSGRVPPAIVLMFSMQTKTAKLLPAPNNTGWFVVYLDKIDKGDASKDDQLVSSVQRGIGSNRGNEYAEQFQNAVRALIVVKQNPQKIAKVKADLSGQAAPAP